MNVIATGVAYREAKTVTALLRWTGCLILLGSACVFGAVDQQPAPLWILTPMSKPEPPAVSSSSGNPIDSFIIQQYREKGLKPVPPADILAMHRRSSIRLVGEAG